MDCRAALTSLRKQPSPQPAPQPQPQSQQSKGTKRGADKEAGNERVTSSHKQIDQRFKSAKHAPAAAQPPTAQKQSQTQPQPTINGAATASTGSKASGLSSSLSSSSSSSPSSASHSAPCPVGFDAALWAQLTSRPSPVAIPANSIKLTYLHGLLSASECLQLTTLPCGRFERSEVGTTGSRISPIRTSSSALVSDDTSIGRCVRKRIATLTGVSNPRIEPLNVVRYKPGQQYKRHYDSSLARPSPRQYTIFAYLNDVEGGGGETEFTKLGVKFKPRRGDALLWENHASRHEEHHAHSKHAGRPPISGVKYGLNCWIKFGDGAEDEESDAQSSSSSSDDDGSESDDGSSDGSRSSHGSASEEE